MTIETMTEKPIISEIENLLKMAISVNDFASSIAVKAGNSVSLIDNSLKEIERMVEEKKNTAKSQIKEIEKISEHEINILQEIQETLVEIRGAFSTLPEQEED